MLLIRGLSTRDLGSASDADRGSGFKYHSASTRPQSGSELRAVLRNSAWDAVKQCNAGSLGAVWSLCATTLNPDRESGSSESVFSARVESPKLKITTIGKVKLVGTPFRAFTGVHLLLTSNWARLLYLIWDTPLLCTTNMLPSQPKPAGTHIYTWVKRSKLE